MEQLLQQVEAYRKEIAEFSVDKDAAETFRIKYLATKGLVKNVMAEMKNVPNEKKREFGQILLLIIITGNLVMEQFPLIFLLYMSTLQGEHIR